MSWGGIALDPESQSSKIQSVNSSNHVNDSSASPSPDLGAIFDEHVAHEFIDHDVEATMKTMTAHPYVFNVATMTGGFGRAGVQNFYQKYFVGKMPADTQVSRISRTVGKERVVDELILSFTHDVPLEFMLPGIPPTGRKVELPHVVVMKFEGGKVAHEHIYWDQGSLLAQVGLLDPTQLPVVAAEPAQKLRHLSQDHAGG